MGNLESEINWLQEELGLPKNEAEYVAKNFCLEGAEDECEYYQRTKDCAGCTHLNGFVAVKTSPDEKPKLTSLMKKSLF